MDAPEYLAQYNLGRQARAAGYYKSACNIPASRMAKRSWWLAGWHDEDIETEARKNHDYESRQNQNTETTGRQAPNPDDR